MLASKQVNLVILALTTAEPHLSRPSKTLHCQNLWKDCCVYREKAYGQGFPRI